MGVFFLKKKLVAYVLIVMGLLGLFILLTTFLPKLLLGKSSPGQGIHVFPILMFLLILFISSFIKITQQWIISERRSKNIETEKLNTELSFLKSQINPHFLFNTLNNIYALALTKSDFTADAVMKLSSLMRYVVDDAKNNYVPLEKEIEYLNHFVELQRLRLNEKVVIELHVEGNYDNLVIAPLILMPFVENIFKYGISTHEDSKVLISLFIKETNLYLRTVNQAFKHTNVKNLKGIGIDNTIRRLDLLYPDKYSLHIDDLNSEFIVDLKLILS
jgi:two-component system LytT family sensor kinase